MACNLPRFSRAEIALARSDEPHVSSISTKKLSLRIYDIKTRPDEHDIVIISGKWLDISWYRGRRHGFRGIGYVSVELNKKNIYISTHRYLSKVLLWKMFSDKFFNWLFAKSLPTNNQKQCQLHNKRKECVECVLGRFIPYIDTVLENKNKI